MKNFLKKTSNSFKQRNTDSKSMKETLNQGPKYVQI